MISADCHECRLNGSGSPVDVTDCRPCIPFIHLAMMKFNGDYVGMIAVSLSFSGRDLVEAIAEELGCASATLSISIKDNCVDPMTALGDASVITEDIVTITNLTQPPVHNGIYRCDSCEFQRFCHLGFSGDVAVIALCGPCGGQVNEEAM